MCNDPAYKYSLLNICDKSEDMKTWTSYRLKDHVLYLETLDERYELARAPAPSQSEESKIFQDFDQYRLSKLREPAALDNDRMAGSRRPLPTEDVELLLADLDWSDFRWGSDRVVVRELEIGKLLSYKYYSVTSE